jgi:hypothetical protein
MIRLPSLILILLLSACSIKSSLNFSDARFALQTNRAPASDYQVNALVAPRSYIESVLIQVFAISNSDTSTLDLLKNKIYFNGSFGGECDPYAAGENSNKQIEFPREICDDVKGLTVDSRPIPNPARYAWTADVCEELAIGRLNPVMNQIIPNWSTMVSKPVPDPTGVTKIYQLFHRQRVPAANVLTALLDVGKASPDQIEAWRNILISICISPTWQYL